MQPNDHRIEDELTLSQFDSSSAPGAREWVIAISMGFNGKQPSEKAIELFMKTIDDDGIVATQVHSASKSLDSAVGGLPVGTFGVFRAQANLGAGMVTAGMMTNATVRTAHKRRGILRQMIELNMKQLAEEGVPLALLTASSAAIYGRFGFQNVIPEIGVTVIPTRFTMRPEVERLIEGYQVDWALRETLFDKIREISLRAHEVTRGSTARHPSYDLEFFRDDSTGDYDAKYRGLLCKGPDGNLDGYVVYSFEEQGTKLKIRDMDFVSGSAELALWDHLVRIEGVREIVYGNFALSSPLRLALVDQRALKVTEIFDLLWARVLDPVACLQARSYTFAAHAGALSASMQVEDPLGFATGKYCVKLGEGSTLVTRLDEDAVVEATVSINALVELVYGSTSVSTLSTLGMIADLTEDNCRKWEALFAAAGPARFTNCF